jgi:choline dehydrogenase
VARAEREVILAAGAIGSPHLLMLSGIGRADHLEAHGVKVVHELRGVGENLQDHLMAIVQNGVGREGSHAYGRLSALTWLGRYALFGTGPLAHPPVHTGGFVKTSAGLARPDLQFHVVPWGMFTPNTDDHHDPDAGRFLTILPTLLYPESRGEVRLRSADPFAAPILEPRYLSAKKDLDTLVAGVELARAIAAAEPLARHCTGEIKPGPSAKSGEALRDDVRLRMNTVFHPVGTCKMGTADDADAVVDPELRVRGLEGLRVVDGSIMPTIVGGNTHAPIVMIAEKAADLIRGHAS